MTPCGRTYVYGPGSTPATPPSARGDRASNPLAATQAVLSAPNAPQRVCDALYHDLRAPLARASAALHAMMRQGDDATPVDCPERHIEFALSSLHHVDRILSKLPGRLARSDRPAAAIDLRTLIGVVREDLDAVWADSSLRIAGDLPRVLADPERLRIAFRTLFFNAIAQRRPRVPAEICIRGWRHGGRALITLMDNGRGPARAPGRAAGSGLTVARMAAEACGGSLRLVPREVHGTAALLDLAAVPLGRPQRPEGPPGSDRFGPR